MYLFRYLRFCLRTGLLSHYNFTWKLFGHVIASTNHVSVSVVYNFKTRANVYKTTCARLSVLIDFLYNFRSVWNFTEMFNGCY